MTKTRLEAFSDGVIAIIITIMVLELKIPHEATWEALFELWPVTLSYILSFINIGIYWGNHHHLLHTTRKLNSGIIWANLNLLFWLSLMPFATAWMGENHFATNTVAVYSAILLMCGAAYYILQRCIMAGYKESSPMIEALQKQTTKANISTISYFTAIPLAFVHPAISGVLIVFVAALWLIPDKNIEKALDN